MEPDPIVEEVRQTRDQLAKAFDYDVEAIFKDLREKQRHSQRRVIRLPAKRTSQSKPPTSEASKPQ